MYLRRVSSFGVFAAASFFCAFVMHTSNLTAEPGESTRRIKIGAILPLSGNAAPYGQAIQNGIRLAKDKLLKDGHPVEVLFEDDALKPLNTFSAYKKLTLKDKVDGVICFASNNCNTISKQAESSGIPLIAIASDGRISKDKKSVFNFWVTPEAENNLMFDLLTSRKIKKVAVVSTIQDGALAVRDDFAKRGEDHFEILFNETYPPEVTDFRGEILRIAVTRPDAILMILMPGQPGNFAKQLRESGNKTPIYSYEMTEDKAEIDVSKGALVGTIISTASTGTPDFIKQYQDTFKSTFLVGAPNGYDSTMLIELAFRQGGSSSAACEILRTLKDYSGATGKFSASGDNRFWLPAVLKVTEASGFREIDAKRISN